VARRKPSRLTTGRLQLLRLFSTLLASLTMSPPVKHFLSVSDSRVVDENIDATKVRPNSIREVEEFQVALSDVAFLEARHTSGLHRNLRRLSETRCRRSEHLESCWTSFQIQGAGNLCQCYVSGQIECLDAVACLKTCEIQPAWRSVGKHRLSLTEPDGGVQRWAESAAARESNDKAKPIMLAPVMPCLLSGECRTPERSQRAIQ